MKRAVRLQSYVFPGVMNCGAEQWHQWCWAEIVGEEGSHDACT